MRRLTRLFIYPVVLFICVGCTVWVRVGEYGIAPKESLANKLSCSLIPDRMLSSGLRVDGIYAEIFSRNSSGYCGVNFLTFNENGVFSVRYDSVKMDSEIINSELEKEVIAKAVEQWSLAPDDAYFGNFTVNELGKVEMAFVRPNPSTRFAPMVLHRNVGELVDHPEGGHKVLKIRYGDRGMRDIRKGVFRFIETPVPSDAFSLVPHL